jgi:predicted SAM-dependent methyltransferase
MKEKLHLGCGKTILKEWINLDIRKGQGVDIVADLEMCSEIPLPFEDNSIDEFYASHLIEHIHFTLSLMQELHRIAKNDSKAVFRLQYGLSDDKYVVKPYFLDSFACFSQPYYWRADYGYKGDWKTEKISLFISQAVYKKKSFHEIYEDVMKKRNVVSEMVVELRAIKPTRVMKKESQTRPVIEFLMV